MNVSLKQIEAFLALASTLSFHQAATLVHLSQPALSSNIRRLEEAVGARLFDRDTRSVSLTAVGVEFLEFASGLQQQVDRGCARIQDFVLGKQGALVVAVAPSLASGFVPEVIVRFTTAYPNVKLTLHDVLADVSIDMVRSGVADLALTPQRVDAQDLQHDELFRDHLVLLCTSDHPLAAKRHINWNDVIAFDQIVKTNGSSVRQLIDAQYIRHGVPLRPAFEVEQVSTMLGLIAAGLGIGVLPFSVIETVNMKGLVCRRFSKAASSYRTICAVRLRGRSAPPTVEPFVQLCREKAEADRPREVAHLV